MLFNIAVGLFVIALTVTIQGYGTVFWIRKVKKRGGLESFGKHRNRWTLLLISSSFFLMFLHLVQTSIWAILYLILPEVTEFETFEKSMYFSLVTFTTLGYGEITIGSSNRILAGLEAINGITLIGWSTAFMFAIFQQMLLHTKQIK
ncbi:MAG: two pore domain potassium channel family protein [Flavobacteriaceae bacterium]|nr:MAG: two pore domain potassium channel family protein [Flavobacteriaceae bacterium]